VVPPAYPQDMHNIWENLSVISLTTRWRRMQNHILVIFHGFSPSVGRSDGPSPERQEGDGGDESA